MDDERLVELFVQRSEEAVALSEQRYGPRCLRVAENILGNRQDAEECVSDALLAAWNAIPPARPARLGAYLARIARNAALDRLDRERAGVRGGGAVRLCIDELAECLPAPGGDEAERIALRDALNGFLASLPKTERGVFLRRYWAAAPVSEVAGAFGMGESRVKMMLLRTRKKLREHMRKEGFDL